MPWWTVKLFLENAISKAYYAYIIAGLLANVTSIKLKEFKFNYVSTRVNSFVSKIERNTFDVKITFFLGMPSHFIFTSSYFKFANIILEGFSFKNVYLH